MVMGAPKNNQFWKARSKHGRGKIFSTPEILWQAACEYFKWVEENPLKKAIVYQGAVSTETESLMRAMTIEGLCIFLDVPTQTFLNYCDKENDSYKDFFEITTRIREIIRTQKFEGASAGMLNPNIIARDLGLSEKRDVTSKGESINNFRELTDEELNEKLERLNVIKGNNGTKD